MKKNKEKELKQKLAAAEAREASAKAEREVFRGTPNQIQQALNRANTAYANRITFEEMPAMVWKMRAITDFFEGRRMPEYDHILSLKEVLRWVINPESAKDDEKIARFEEMRNKGLL